MNEYTGCIQDMNENLSLFWNAAKDPPNTIEL